MLKTLRLTLTSILLLSVVIASAQITPVADKNQTSTIKKKDYVIRRELRTIPGELFNHQEENSDSLKHQCNNMIPGEPFSREDLINSQRKLTELNYFTTVSLDTPHFCRGFKKIKLVKKLSPTCEELIRSQNELQSGITKYIDSLTSELVTGCIDPDSIKWEPVNPEKMKKIYVLIGQLEQKIISTEFVCRGETEKKIITKDGKNSNFAINNPEESPLEKINNPQPAKSKYDISSAEPALKIYPNPFINAVNIQINQLSEEGAFFNLYNIEGKRIRQEKISNLRTNISLDGLSSGIYVYHVVGERGRLISSGKLKKD
jgi:hypothetical protein